MAQPIDERGSLDQGNQPEVAKQRSLKKIYISPTLLEYGSIAKLTQGASGPFLDAGMNRATVCL